MDVSDETLATLDMTEFSVDCDKNAVKNMDSSPSTSSYTIGPVHVFNNCVFNSCDNFWTKK